MTVEPQFIAVIAMGILLVALRLTKSHNPSRRYRQRVVNLTRPQGDTH